MEKVVEKIEMIPEDLEKAGYRRYENNGIKNPNSLCFYQKAIRDEKGIRYFIDVYVFDYRDFAIEKTWGYQPEVQFNAEVTTNVMLHADEREVFEKKFEELWKALGEPYYELG